MSPAHLRIESDPMLDPGTINALIREISSVDDELGRGSSDRAGLTEARNHLREFVMSEPLDAGDPYLVLALQRALIELSQQVEAESGPRGQIRVALERARQALRDLVDEAPVADDQPGKSVARWLADRLDVRQQEVADLLGVSSRTFQRWLSESDPSSPEGDDAMRLRIVAKITNHLRHAMTGRGVLLWLRTPHPRIHHAPAELLEKPEQFPLLVRLASAARSSRSG